MNTEGFSVDEVENVERILSVVLDWSGVSDNTPDDTEILWHNGRGVTLGDLRDAFGALSRIARAATSGTSRA